MTLRVCDDEIRESAVFTGEQLLDEIADLLSERLPRLAPHDPVRQHLGSVLPLLYGAVRRPIATLAPDNDRGQS